MSSKNAKSAVIFCAAILLASCATYSNLKIVVVDSETSTPLEGAAVSVTYSISIFRDGVSTGVTDKNGLVILKGDYSSGNYSFEARIKNGAYDDHAEASVGRTAPWNRSKDFIPIEPDEVIRLDSLKTVEKKHLAWAEHERRVAEETARLLAGPSTFWPDENEKLLADRSNALELEAHQHYIFGRWKNAPKEFLGNATDKTEILRLVKNRDGAAEVDEYRWLTPNLVMVSASWVAGPVAGAGYICVLERSDKGWVMLRSYLQWVA